MTITHELEDLDGVISVRGDVESKHVHVEWNPPSDEPLILETLNEIGYPAENV
jgi:copper chaperone CopZ